MITYRSIYNNFLRNLGNYASRIMKTYEVYERFISKHITFNIDRNISYFITVNMKIDISKKNLIVADIGKDKFLVGPDCSDLKTVLMSGMYNGEIATGNKERDRDFIGRDIYNSVIKEMKGDLWGNRPQKTPFLNRLKKDGDYFDDIQKLVKKGTRKTTKVKIKNRLCDTKLADQMMDITYSIKKSKCQMKLESNPLFNNVSGLYLIPVLMVDFKNNEVIYWRYHGAHGESTFPLDLFMQAGAIDDIEGIQQLKNLDAELATYYNKFILDSKYLEGAEIW